MYWALCSGLILTNVLFYLQVNGLTSVLSEFTLSPQKTLLPLGVLVGTCIFPRWIRDSIAHFRLRNPLPGSEAFSRWAKTDPRISLEKLKARVGSVPKSPAKQNVAWYELYQSVKREPEIVVAHKKYLLFRDLAILQADAILIWAASSIVATPIGWPVWILLIVAYTVFVICARNTGVHFVQNVMAIAR